ncbi:membrane protein insertion efficiency factor YidD [Solimicrobium silvestre]|uniref:Putative membrane protein insertion efficiency factor n=1 Tax=Solimicrobium silvestre TaxID=2099400 RepID=A0A2S9H220_9BURK|nr:membrane protein insertion efficiency factor YidD [Solimicrobium silvestre]PRC94032.1 membrane protein insertion efficiency factor [Solimicrobium silvestre]
MKSILLFLLRAYKLTISPYLGQNCRFYPSCSAYAELAIRRHGVLKGSALAGKRLCKCHPWHSGGIDLVPENETNKDQQPDENSKTRLKLARSYCGTHNKCTSHHHLHN